MGGELSRTDMAAAIKELVSNPLMQVPEDMVPMTFDFYAFFAGQLSDEGYLSICTRIRYWVQHDNLTKDQLERAFEALRSPSASAAMKFKGDVPAALSAAVSAIQKNDRGAVVANTDRLLDAAYKQKAADFRQQEIAKYGRVLSFDERSSIKDREMATLGEILDERPVRRLATGENERSGDEQGSGRPD